MTDQAQKVRRWNYVGRACAAATIVVLTIGLVALGIYVGTIAERARQSQPAAAAEPETRQRFTIAGEEFLVDAGSSITIEIDDDIVEPTRTHRIDQTGSYRGASVTTTEKGASNFAGQNPNIDMWGFTAAGGGLSWDVTAAAKSMATPFLIVGLVMLIAGGIVAWQWNVRYGIGIVALGLGTIAVGVFVERYPLLFIAFAAMALTAAGVFIYQERKKARLLTSTEAVATGIEKSPAEIKAVVKANIAAAAKDAGNFDLVKDTISKVKASAGITSAASAPAPAAEA